VTEDDLEVFRLRFRVTHNILENITPLTRRSVAELIYSDVPLRCTR
jgi:hypothetical protein